MLYIWKWGSEGNNKRKEKAVLNFYKKQLTPQLKNGGVKNFHMVDTLIYYCSFI